MGFVVQLKDNFEILNFSSYFNEEQIIDMNSSNFSDNAKRILHEASVLAEQWNHPAIDSGHLLNAAIKTKLNEDSVIYQNLQKNKVI